MQTRIARKSSPAVLRARIARHVRTIRKGVRVQMRSTANPSDLDIGLVTRVTAKCVVVRWLESGTGRHDAIELVSAE